MFFCKSEPIQRLAPKIIKRGRLKEQHITTRYNYLTLASFLLDGRLSHISCLKWKEPLQVSINKWIFFMANVSAKWPGHVKFESESTAFTGKDSVVLKGGSPVARCPAVIGTEAIFEDGRGGECWEHGERMKHLLAREL